MEYAHCEDCYRDIEAPSLAAMPTECPTCGGTVLESDGATDAGTDWRAELQWMSAAREGRS